MLYVCTPAQLMRPGVGRNASCALSDWLTSRLSGAVCSLGSCGSYVSPHLVYFLLFACVNVCDVCVTAGKLELKIPWKNLTKDPLYVTIDEVYIVVGPKIGGWSHAVTSHDS